MPYWNKDLQQWGYFDWEEVSEGQWLGFNRSIPVDEMSEDMPTQVPYHGLEKMTHVPLRTQLAQERLHHQKEVERVTQLLELIDRNPDIERFVNLSRGYRL